MLKPVGIECRRLLFESLQNFTIFFVMCFLFVYTTEVQYKLLQEQKCLISLFLVTPTDCSVHTWDRNTALKGIVDLKFQSGIAA